MTKNDATFVEVDFVQRSKANQAAYGDVFLSQRVHQEDRIICVLTDGLGSGVKANVLATLTATMAMKYVCSDIDIREASEIIMATLPVCSKRKIGYSTFTIVDIKNDGEVSIIEYENPAYILLRNSEVNLLDKKDYTIRTETTGERKLLYSNFIAKESDRLIFFSDGVTQSGIGTESMPLGWSRDGVSQFVRNKCLRSSGKITARELAKSVVARSLENDQGESKDDITCAVVNFRKPRKLLVLSGPPYDKRNDTVLSHKALGYDGRKVVCGGTTASIIARETARSIDVDLSDAGLDVPPASKMRGFDLVTEGTLTLTKTMEILERGNDLETMPDNAAVRLASLLLDSDKIEFLVGTRINEAHQDPKLPAELDIRRNLIKKMVNVLNKKYVKEAGFTLI